MPGKVAWSNITKEEAAAACAFIGTGWRLCAGAEWQDACNGSVNTAFPYGATYVATKCNGYDDKLPGDAVAQSRRAPRTGCISDQNATVAGDELYDMSGNLKEWVTTLPVRRGRFRRDSGRALHDGSLLPAARRRLQHPQLHRQLRGDASVTRRPWAAVRRARPPAPTDPGPPAVGRVPLLSHRRAAPVARERTAP